MSSIPAAAAPEPPADDKPGARFEKEFDGVQDVFELQVRVPLCAPPPPAGSTRGYPPARG